MFSRVCLLAFALSESCSPRGRSKHQVCFQNCLSAVEVTQHLASALQALSSPEEQERQGQKNLHKSGPYSASVLFLFGSLLLLLFWGEEGRKLYSLNLLTNLFLGLNSHDFQTFSRSVPFNPLSRLILKQAIKQKQFTLLGNNSYSANPFCYVIVKLDLCGKPEPLLTDRNQGHKKKKS